MALSTDEAAEVFEQSDNWELDEKIGGSLEASRQTGMWQIDDGALTELLSGGWAVIDMASHTNDEYVRVWVEPFDVSLSIE